MILKLTSTTRSANLLVQSERTANGLGNSYRKGEKSPLLTVVFLCLSKNLNVALIHTKPFMVGVLGSTRACWSLFPVYQPSTSTAQSLVTFGGGLITTEKELVMSQHNYTQNQTKTNPLNNSVSNTEQQLIEFSQIIGTIQESNAVFTHGLATYIDRLDKSVGDLTLSEIVALISEYKDSFNRESKKPKSKPKTSLFNVLTKRNKRVIADRVSFEKALQYSENDAYLIKFAGMTGRIA